MLRKLGTFERAMLISNNHSPFNIVSVLKLKNAPTPEKLEQALGLLQLRHPFLRVRITDMDNQPWFEAIPNPAVPFRWEERQDDQHWVQVAENEMALRFGIRKGPLFNATYLYGSGKGDLILNFHHTVLDSVSGVNLLDELLRLCSDQVVDQQKLGLAAPLETRFPRTHKGFGRAVRLTGYILAQVGDEFRFRWRNRGERIPPVHLGGSGFIKVLILPESLVEPLSTRSRVEKVTLNSILNAAQLLAVNRNLYGGRKAAMQTYTFANLRPYVTPPVEKEDLACNISMMRHTLDVSGDQDIWDLSKKLHRKIYHTLKGGDKFSAFLMSETLLKMVTRMKTMRFGASALNFSGAVALEGKYGEIVVEAQHGFVSGYDLGPELASQARLFNDQVCWDFIYLDTDLEEAAAQKLVEDIHAILVEAVRMQPNQ